MDVCDNCGSFVAVQPIFINKSEDPIAMLFICHNCGFNLFNVFKVAQFRSLLISIGANEHNWIKKIAEYLSKKSGNKLSYDGNVSF